VFVGIDDSSVKGYLLYSPEHNDVYVNTHVIFHENDVYDGSYTDKSAIPQLSDNAVPTEDVENFKYLEGTDHLDPDDGLLYRAIKVEERNYPGQGRFIVCYRAHVYPDGKLCMKTSKEAIHVRDVEEYYRKYVTHLKQVVNEKHIQMAASDRSSGVAAIKPAKERRHKRRRAARLTQQKKKRRTDHASLVYHCSDEYVDNGDSEYVSENETDLTHLESYLLDDSHVHRLVESALYGDLIAMSVLCSGTACKLPPLVNPTPTIKQ